MMCPGARDKGPRRGWCAVLLGCLLSAPVFADSPPGLLVLPRLESLEPQAKDSVSISMDAPLLTLAARFLDSNTPEDRDLKDLVSNLRGVYVRSFTFDHSVPYPANAFDSIRKQLRTACWQSIVSVRKSSEASAVDIFVCRVDEKARGLAILASEPRQLTIVNIVGAIDLEKLRRLEGHFGIPRVSEGPRMSEGK